MLNTIFFALWFFLPAAIANVTPIFAAHISWLKKYDYPIDCYKTYKGKRIFGSHKTFRGFAVGIIFATITLYIQQLLVINSSVIANYTSQVDYANLPILILGPLFGIGALAGDAIESFFKRQRGIKPGDGWFLFDQTDYIIGGALATMPFIKLSILQYVILIIIWLIIHLIASFIGFKLHLKEKPI